MGFGADHQIKKHLKNKMRLSGAAIFIDFSPSIPESDHSPFP